MKELIEKIARWQNEHIASFDIHGQDVMNAFKGKKEHIAFVRKHAKDLAEYLKLDNHLTNLSELIGLCHDLGRFTQYDKYETFNDAVSIDHATLAIKLFDSCPYKSELSDRDLFLMQFAIFNHNKKEIEPTEDKEAQVLAQIIRDADKLDIYRVLRRYLTSDSLEGAPKFVDADASQEISPSFMDIFVEGKQADYREIKTHGDRKLVRLLWIYDMNFAWTIKKLKETGYIEEIINSLYPKNEQLELGIKKLKEYIDKRLREEDGI